MAKKYNINLIKSRKSYSINQIANVWKVGRKTCSRWIKDGLVVVDADASQILVMGEDLIRFVREKRSARKVPLKKSEFFCFTCKKAVKALTGSEKIIKTGKTIGKNKMEQYNKIGLCEICRKEVNRYLKVYQKD